MMPVLATQTLSAADLHPLLPELVLVVSALLLLVLARRIQSTPLPTLVTTLAALASGAVLFWVLPAEDTAAFGGMFLLDGYARFFKVAILVTVIVVSLISDPSNASGGDDGARAPRAEFNTLLLLAASGMMLAVSGTDLLTIYLGLELLTLCSFVLVGIAVDRPTANEGAIKYFLLGSFASALLLFGISLTYGLTAATGLDQVAEALGRAGGEGSPLILATVGLVTAGMAFKIAAVPFHSWAPDAYQGAPTPVATFLATGSKATGLAVMGRVLLVAFAPEAEQVTTILIVLAAASILVGSLLALPQTKLKRLLAYSSVAHAGYALLGLVAGGAEGASATMLYALFYVFMTLGVFTVVLAMGERGEDLEGYEGLASQRPLTAALMLLFLLSLTGIPPTAGFAAKFVVIGSALREGHVALAVLAVACSVVTAFVYLRVAVLMYMKPPKRQAELHIPVVLFAAMAMAAVVTLLGGVLPGSFANWAVAP